MSRGKAVLFGFFVGGVVSASATLLSTPASGKNLRMQIRNQTMEWKELLEGLKRDGLRIKKSISKNIKRKYSTN